MTTLTLIRALLRDIESGSWPGDTSPIWGEELHGYAWKARWHDDMNAALALHGALLPEWWWQAESFADVFRARVNERGIYDDRIDVLAPTPARALLIATLRGVIAKMEAGNAHTHTD